MALDYSRLKKEVAAPLPETAMAVSELVTELPRAADIDKREILILLREAAFGSSTRHAVPERFDVVGAFGEAGKKPRGTTLWWRDAYEAVSRAVPGPILAELKNPTAAVVGEALALVIHFPQHAAKVLPLLRATSPPPVPASYVAVAMLAGRDALAESHAALARAPSEERRFLAALACAVSALAGPGLTLPVPEGALAILLGQPPLTTVSFPFSPLPGAIARTMLKLGRSSMSSLADRIVAAAPAWFPTEKGADEKPFVSMLLELAFPSRAEHLPGQAPAASALSALQTKVLLALYDHPGWKALGALGAGQQYSMSWYLLRRALPRDPSALRKLLEQT